LLGTQNLDALGVYPLPPTDAASYQARPRSEDERLAKAMTTSCCVVVHGGPRVGKSHAAARAAGESLGDIPVIVPFDADGLRALQDNCFDARLRSRHRRVCVWLDGLDRFIGALDPRVLRRRTGGSVRQLGWAITGRNRDIKLVATIRTEEWNRLLAGVGQEGETARMLSGLAAVVRLDRMPIAGGAPVATEDEVATAAPAAQGEADLAVGSAPPPGARMPARWPWMDGLFLGLLAGALVVVGLSFLVFGHRTLFQAPPISDQIATLTGNLEQQVGHGHVVLSDRVWMHSTEQPSWMIGVQAGSTHSTARNVKQAHSDILQIYDVKDGWLQRELSFEPRARGANAIELQQVAANSTPAGYFNNGGTPEFIAGYSLSKYTPTIVPFGIEWGSPDGQPGYRITALTKAVPALGVAAHATATAALQATYRGRVTLLNAASDPGGNRWLVGYPVGAFALAEQPSDRLLIGYFRRPYDSALTNDVELRVVQIRRLGIATQFCAPTNPYCPGPTDPERFLVPPDKSDSNALLEEWPNVKARWSRPIQVTRG
jgi:hypothetical protein